MTNERAPAIESFGEYLKYLRRRSRLTQEELARAVGYSREQITRLERNQRLPDSATLAALFVPALDLRSEPALVARFLELAAAARGESAPTRVTLTHAVETSTDTARSKRRQTNAHLRAAEWAELAQGDVLQAAREYGLAGDLRRAADALTDRGTMLFNQGKAQETAAVIDELMDTLRRDTGTPDPDILRRLLTTRGDVLLNTERAAEAEANYREALKLAKSAVRATLVYRLGVALTQRGHAAEALTLTRETLVGLEPQHLMLRAQLRIVEGGACLTLARYEEAERANLDALAVAEQFGVGMPLMAAGIRARAHNSLGIINAIRGAGTEARAHWQQAVTTAKLAGMRALEYRTQGNIAALAYEEGALDEAEIACNAALAGLKSISDMQAAAKFVALRANLHLMRGEVADSLRLAREACEIKEQVGDRNSYLASLQQQARALIVLGEWNEARTLTRQGLSELEQLGDERTRGYWLILLSEIEMLEGAPQAARSALDSILELSGAAQDVKLLSDRNNHLAIAQLLAGEMGDAAQTLAAPFEGPAETELEHELCASLVQLATGALTVAGARAAETARRAQSRGYRQIQQRAARVARHVSERGGTIPNPAKILYGQLTNL